MQTGAARLRARMGGVDGVMVMELERLVLRRAVDEAAANAPALLEVALASLCRYEVSRNTDDRAWSLSLVTVRWRMVLWGRVCETHNLALVCEGDDPDSVDPDKDNALRVVQAIDKAVFAWQRAAHSAPSPAAPVPPISLLKPQTGLAAAASEAALGATPPNDLGEQLMSAPRSTSLSSLNRKSVSREAPGDCLFVDEVALERVGLVSSAQWYVLGPRFIGTWTAWNLGSTIFSTSSVALPAVLAVTPLALTLFLPTVNFFCPFPLRSVSAWGASGSTFNFRFTVMNDVSQVVSFTTGDPQMLLDTVVASVSASHSKGQPYSPLPDVYPKPT